MITEGYLARHYQGRRGGRGPAVIDIAQDHLLFHLYRSGVLDLGIALKGGTAIRKFWAGNAGRFSTDLDFAGVSDASAELLLEAVDGSQVGQFGFGVEEIDGTRRVRLVISSPFGSLAMPARLDLGRRSAWLAPRPMQLLPLPIHARYDFTMPCVPALRLEEIVAEKLARYRRASLARDLYDLAWFAHQPFDEALVRRLWVLKVWLDVNRDRLGTPPVHADDVLRTRPADEFKPEAIGYLTTPINVPDWVQAIRVRFGFLRDLDEQEIRWARCNPGDAFEVDRAIEALRASHP